MGVVSIALILSVAVLFTGCGGKKASDAVDVPGYKGIEVEKEKVESIKKLRALIKITIE